MRRPRPRVVTRFVEPPPVIEKPVITRYVDAPSLIDEPIIRTYREPIPPPLPPKVDVYDEPIIVSKPRYQRIVIDPPRENYVSYPRRTTFSVEGKLDPLMLDDDTVYLKYNTRERSDFQYDHMPRARIVELDEDPVYTSKASKGVLPAYESRGHYEPTILNSSTDYFFGRQDFR